MDYSTTLFSPTVPCELLRQPPPHRHVHNLSEGPVIDLEEKNSRTSLNLALTVTVMIDRISNEVLQGSDDPGVRGMAYVGVTTTKLRHKKP